MHRISKLLRTKLGIDRAIAYTISSRGVQFSSSIFTVYFTARFLSPNEQGFYFTFSSILALQVFFELGFTGVITQFVAHEASHLSWTEDYKLVGEEKYKSRLASLLHFCVKWYLRLAGILLLTLIITGILFFRKYSAQDLNINWKLPWVLLVIGTGLNFVIAPISSSLEGLGKVKEIAKIRLFQQVITPFIFCGGLALGAKLFVSGFIAISNAVIFMILLYKLSLHKYIITIWRHEISDQISYLREIFPYQWKIALSWISGYFIFQLFNPVLFASEGATIAGQMGMTLSALNALFAMAYSWINTKVPVMSGLIALSDFKSLDKLFFKTLKQILLIAILAVFCFIIAVYILQINDISILGSKIGKRFLPIAPLSLFSLALLLQVPINSWATYLRCHKKEPLLVNSVIGGILCCLSAIFLGKYFGLYGLIGGFLTLQMFVGLVWVYIIFNRKRKEWHV